MSTAPIATPRIDCPRCTHPIMDGEVTRGRVMRHFGTHSESKCPRCKAWVRVPLVLNPESPPCKTPARG